MDYKLHPSPRTGDHWRPRLPFSRILDVALHWFLLIPQLLNKHITILILIVPFILFLCSCVGLFKVHLKSRLLRIYILEVAKLVPTLVTSRLRHLMSSRAFTEQLLLKRYNEAISDSKIYLKPFKTNKNLFPC